MFDVQSYPIATRSLDIITLQRPSVRSRLTHMLLYFGILYPNNSGSPWRLNHSALQQIVLLYCPRDRRDQCVRDEVHMTGRQQSAVLQQMK